MTYPTRSNNKILDLSQPIRLTGLSSGAKIQLLVLSRSPSVVSVALQFPEDEGGGTTRLIDKFPSTTTLWLLLRKFESDRELPNGTRNFTARAIPQVEGGESNSGRLFYETPVIHVMGRELFLFADLQNSLAQLGFNSGSVLLRLGFRPTKTPLEQAMTEIDQYFKSVEGDDTRGSHVADTGNADSVPDSTQPALDQELKDKASSLEPVARSQTTLPSQASIAAPRPLFHEASAPITLSSSELTETGPVRRSITIFAPPSESTPAAARQVYNDKDYEPTIDHAKLHQLRLATHGRNKPLPSDTELAAQAEIQAKRRSDIKKVKIKIRFPDQSTAIGEFSNVESNKDLYEQVKELLENEREPFSLNFSTVKGPQMVPREGTVRLITDLGMVGNVLVNVIWEEGASIEARRGSTLKGKYREKASPIEVKEPESVDVDRKEINDVKGKGAEKRDVEKKGGVPKWLKLPGKK